MKSLITFGLLVSVALILSAFAATAAPKADEVIVTTTFEPVR